MRLTVTEWGAPDAPPVVCLHAAIGHGRRFRRLAEQGLPAHRVLALDLRGHGHSTWLPPWSIEQHVADVMETVDALELDSAAWIGHSFGGRLVAELAARSPDLVERAVLLDPAMHVPPSLATMCADAVRPEMSFASPTEGVEARLGEGTLFSTPRSFIEEEACEHLVQGDDGRFRWRWSPAAVVVAFSEMAAAPPPWPRCPTLVVVGERSWMPVDVPVRSSVTRVDVPGGHAVLWDDFDATAGAIASFLA